MTHQPDNAKVNADLLEENQRLKKQIEHLLKVMAELDKYSTAPPTMKLSEAESVNFFKDQLKAKDEEIAELKITLNKYADKENWSVGSHSFELEDIWGGNSCHGWAIAKKTLKMWRKNE